MSGYNGLEEVWDDGVLEREAEEPGEAFKQPVDVICYGKRQHFDTRNEAVAFYREGVLAAEGSEHERYTKIYFDLVCGSSPVVSDGEPEFVEKTVNKLLVADKSKVLALIKADELSINSPEIFDITSSKLLQEDRDIIKALLTQDGCYAAQFLRKYIENDKELILCAALGGDEPRGALAYASEQLQGDKEFVLEMIKLDASDVRYISDKLSNDPEIIASALQHAESDYDVSSIKETLGESLLSDMLEVYIDKQKEQEKGITAKFDFSKVPDELLSEFYVETFDTAEEMFNDLYLYDADRETLRDAIRVLKQQDMHSAVVTHMDVRFDGEKYYYSPEMEEFERVVLERQKNSLEDKIAEAREVGRDKEGAGSIDKGKTPGVDR